MGGVSLQVVGVIPKVADAGLSTWASHSFMEKLAALMPSIVYVYNPKTQSNEYSNRNVGEALGYTAEELQTMGATFLPTVAHPEDLPRLGEYFGELVAMKDGEVAMMEYRMRRKTGGWAWFRSYDTIFEREDDGEVRRIVGVASDITPQKEATAKLELLNDELSAFAYVATHDMKAPIDNIAGLSDVLASMPEFRDGEAAELLAMIQRSCRQAAQKIRDAVGVTVATRDPEAPVTCVFEELMQTVRARFEPEIAGTRAELVERYDVPSVRFPRVQLESVLENLLGNALKYRVEARTPRIELSSSTRADGATLLRVRDNGIGIDAEQDGERIMGLFKRADTSAPGSGVGLYLVRQMMLRGGGSVEVDGALGRYAAFTLVFPPPETLS